MLSAIFDDLKSQTGLRECFVGLPNPLDALQDTAMVAVAQLLGNTMTPVLKQQLQQCEAEIRNVMKAIRQGILTETTKACLEELETQRDSLKASILQLQLERHKFTKEEIVDWISKYKYGNIDDPDYRKEIIDTFVNSVFVYDDKLVLTYNYKDGSETLTLQEIEAALSSNLDGMCPPNQSSALSYGAVPMIENLLGRYLYARL